MQIHSSLAEAARAGSLQGCALALGNFDGVHLGHCALFEEGKRHAPTVALTFRPHPGRVLQPDLAPRLITCEARKLELLAEQGLIATIVQPFTTDYARTTADEFEAAVFDELGAAHVVVGSDFTYGRKRSGTVDSLTLAAGRRGRWVHVVSPITVDGVVVSSSKIREYVLEGRVEAASRLLGRPFDLEGIVVRGVGRGSAIGIPTANIAATNELWPADGVYAVRAHVLSQSPALSFSAVANIGVKPTFGGTEVTLEAHLLDFAGDLYGQRLRLFFVARIRPERRFPSASELVRQIAHDAEAARVILASSPGGRSIQSLDRSGPADQDVSPGS